MKDELHSVEFKRDKKINLADLSTENVIDAIRLNKFEELIYSKNTFLLSPFALEEEEEELQSKIAYYEKEGLDVSDEKKAYNKLLEEKRKNTDRIQSARLWLVEHRGIQETLDDEQAVKIYKEVILQQYLKAFNSVLIGKIDSNENLMILKDLISVLETSNGNSPAIILSKKILNSLFAGDKKVDIVKPELGKFSDFIKINVEPTSIDSLSRETVVYLDEMDVLGVVFFSKGSTDPNIKILMEHGFSSKGTSGVARKLPSLELRGVTGNVYPIDLYEGIEPDINSRKLFFDNLYNNLAQRGFNQIATHTFDPRYLIAAISSGIFTIPHLNGFQVESAFLVEGETPNLKYVKSDFPYFFYILNETDLLTQFPRNKAENNFNGFHFINNGLPFADKSFLHSVVPKVFKKRILKWVNTMSKEEVTRIFGDKDPEMFFVSD